MTIIDQNTLPATRVSYLGLIVNQAVQAATIVRTILTPRPINPEKELARTARRDAARRAADSLMR